MFKFFRSKHNFEAIFSSLPETHKYIYGNKSKTSSILGDESFIESWLSSKYVGQVTAIIKSEALKGDIPSLKQMIWLCELYFNAAENNARDADQLLAMKTKYMQDRVDYCQKAIECGLKDQAYYAMTSSAKLYLLRSKLPGSMEDPITRDALASIIKYAKIFIGSGSAERELIDDAKGALEHYGLLAQVMKAF